MDAVGMTGGAGASPARLGDRFWTWSTLFGSQAGATFLVVPIALLFALFAVAVIRSPSLLSNAGLGSAIIVAAPLVLATYSLTFIVMAGRGGVDLSIGPLIGFINVTLVVLFEKGYVTSPFGFFLYAIAVGVAYQLIVALIIVFVRIQPIIVALSGFLTLAGLNLIILARPGGVAPGWMESWGLGTTVWSPVLAILAVATVAWFVFKKTAFYDHLRLMGSDERTAYTAGVSINAVRLWAHVIAGVYAALAALCFTSLISSGDPTQGSTYTLMAVTALVLGGTSLGGGRGTIVGSMLGALNIYLITYVLATFNFGKVQSFVTQLSYGAILVLALLTTIFLPHIQRIMRGVSPFVLFLLLALVSTGVGLYAFDERRAESLASQAPAAGSGITSLSAGGGIQSATSISSITSLSASSAAAAAAADESGPRGDGVLIALVIAAAVFFLVWLLYSHFGFATVALAGTLGLLVLGYGVHDGGGAPPPAPAVPVLPDFLGIEGAAEARQLSLGTVLGSPWVWGTLAVAGSVLLGSFLVFLAVPSSSVHVGVPALLLCALAALAAGAVLAYERGAGGAGLGAAVTPAIGALTVGAALLAVAMPKFQRVIGDITPVMLGLLALAVLGAMFFLAGPDPAPSPAEAAPVAAGGWEPVPLSFSPGFVSLVLLVLSAGVVVFFLTIPGVRAFLARNIAFDRSLRTSSYLTIFVTGFALLVAGSVFLVAGVPLWKFIVAVVAALIGARVVSHFLSDLRRRRKAEAGLARQEGGAAK